MEYDQFLGEVMQKTYLQSAADAQPVIRAVIEAPGERLGDHAQQDLRAH